MYNFYTVAILFAIISLQSECAKKTNKLICKNVYYDLLDILEKQLFFK